MINRKIQIFIVLAAIIVVATIVPSKIRDMILLGGSEADDIFLNLIGTVASLFTLLAAIDIKKRLNTHTIDNTVCDTNQLDIVGKSRNGNSYNQFNLEVKQVLKNLPKFLAKHIVVSISLLVTIITLFIVHFNEIACHFYGITKDANGQLLTVLLTAIGGGAVIYGLYLNNKRIKEQTEQNNIARTQAETAKKQADIVVSNNNDKRFGEAIGYLGSDNSSIVLGGIYSLHQLAKEDSRYIPLVNNLYSGYLKDKSSQFYTDERYKTKSPVVIQAIIDIYFNKDSIFKDEQIDLSDTILINIHFNGCVSNCLFKSGVLKNCFLMYGMKSCEFLGTDITECQFDGKICYCQFTHLDVIETTIGKRFSGCILEECIFELNKINGLTLDCNSVSQVEFGTIDVKSCRFKNMTIDYSSFNFRNGEEISFYKTEFFFSTINIKDEDNLRFDCCYNVPTVNEG